VTDSGFIDQYGNSYSVQEGKPDINAFKKWAYENILKRNSAMNEK